MSITATTIPNIYMAGYSAVPLRLADDNVSLSDNYKYITNIVWDVVEIDTTSPYPYYGIVYTKCSTVEPHTFNDGDAILIDDVNNNGKLDGYYNILKVVNTTSFVISTIFDDATVNNFMASRVIKYSMPPNADNEVRLDLSNTLKDYVTENLSDVNDIYDGPDTRFRFGIACGYESTYVLEFDYGDSTSVGLSGYSMVVSGATSVDDIQFSVGDVITIQQELTAWPYTDNFFAGVGYLGFTGSTAAPTFSGPATVLVTGQETALQYNGYAELLASTGNYMVVNKTFDQSTPVDGGIIYGLNTPEYNATATITNITYSAGTGVIIETNVTLQGAASAGGTAIYADRRTTTTPVDLDLGYFNVYNTRIENNDYAINAFDKYVCQERAANLNNISTILGNTESYNIEKETKSWLLAHTYASDGKIWEPRITMYDSSNTLLSQYRLEYSFDYGASNSIDNFLNNGGNVRLDLFAAHGLSAGDIIEIVAAPYNYNGITTVLSVQSTTNVTVDVPYVGNLLNGAEYIRKVNNGSTQYDYYFPVGIDQINADTNKTLLTGSSLSTIIDNIHHYTVELEYSNSANTNTITFELSDDCSAYDMLHLMWKDSKGSWLSMPFKYKSKHNLEVERKSYYKTEGNWDNDSFGYDSYDRGDKNFYVRSRESKIVNSGWLKQFEVDLIKDLFASPSIYLQQPNGDLVACNINESGIELIKSANQDMIQYSFTVIYSSNNYRF